MKIGHIVSAAICASKERKFVAQHAKKHLPEKMEQDYYDKLVEISGESTHNPVQIVKNWHKAYQANMERLKLVDSLNKPFKSSDTIVSAIKQLFK